MRASPGPRRFADFLARWRSASLTTAWLLVVASFPSGGAIGEEPPVVFETHIAPLLVKNCLGCHQAGDAAGGLDLTRSEAARAGGESQEPAILPHKSADSYLMTRLRDGEMPPKNQGAPLAPGEIALLARWIDEGAAWPADRVLDAYEFTTDKRAGQDWWSLRPVARPAPPRLESPWIENPIDAFVLEKLQRHQLAPAPPADKTELLRRVTFDLIGLPPSPAELDAFLADEAPGAYERVVERLLASSHYGERWARHWLDIAHYADTHGFERDFRRDHAWPYRDYVIRALNEDKPYDEFLREQIAGDVIAPDDPESVAATGFLAAGPWDFVGHVENRDPRFKRLARADDLDDMVTTVMSATVGLTVNCARCHNHKFDPITQEDYYRLWAVFAGVQRGDRDLPIKDSEQRGRQRLGELFAQLGALEGAAVSLADIVSGGNGFGNGQTGAGIDPRSGAPVRDLANELADVKVNTYVQVEHPFVDGVFIPDGGPDGQIHVTLTSTSVFVTGLTDTSGKTWDHIRSGPTKDAGTSTLDGVNYADAPHSILSLHANKGITFDLEAIRGATGYQKMRFQAVVGYGGAEGANRADFWVYVDAKLQTSKAGIRRATGGVPVDLELPAEARFLTLVATDGGDGYSHDQVFFGDARLVPEHQVSETPEQVERRAALVKERDELQARVGFAGPVAPVAKFYGVVSGAAPPVHLLQRGDTESELQEVTPGALSCVQTLPSDMGPPNAPEGERRAALADWVVAAENPLTRRVIVNRLWHHHFGVGLVDTPSDFGFLGGRPSHPELLDWLADELLARRWSLKELHRLMVLSNTYRQSGRPNERGLEIDADNRLLWRKSPRRLEAEAVRDAVLAISGKLNRQQGGPGYRDFEFIERYAPIYRYITPDQPELWRRSIYRFVVRSVPSELMEALDCPNPSNFAPRREETTTPMQGLALLNDPFMTRQSGYFAERILLEAGAEPVGQVKHAYRLALGREPSEEELRLAAEFVGAHNLFQFCRVLLNTNEFLYVD